MEAVGDSWRVRRFAVLAALLVTAPVLLAAPGPVPETQVAVVVTEAWAVTVDEKGRWVLLESRQAPFRVLVDADGTEEDGRHAGIYLTVGDRTFQGVYAGGLAPLIAPQRPWVLQTAVEVRAAGESVWVRMGDAGPSPFPGEDPHPLLPPFYLEAEIRSGSPVLLHLRGSYYLLPTGQPLVQVETADGAWTEHAIRDGKASVAYVFEPRVILFEDGQGSRFRVETDARVVQFESLLGTEAARDRAFEIDFDHSAKDFGQTEVTTTVTIWP